MLQIYPPRLQPLDPATLYDDLELLPPVADRPSVALNMVTTIDGVAAIGGRAAVIGSAVDHLAMRKIRVAADAVLSGAGTLRTEGFDPRIPPDLAARRVERGRPPQPIAVLISRSGDLPLDHPFFQIPEIDRVVITTTAISPERQRAIEQVADVLVVGASDLDVPDALRLLRQRRGVRQLVAEGGPRLNHSLLRVGCVDEIFWTLAPKVAGGGPTMVVGPPLPVDIRAMLVTAFIHEDEIFLRYRLQTVLHGDAGLASADRSADRCRGD